MEVEAFIPPMFAMITLIFVAGLIMLSRRYQVVKEGFDWRYYITFEGEQPPRKSLQTDQHFSNLFEFPMLFFPTCIIAMVVDLSDLFIIGLAWLFFFSRLWHTYVSLTNNRLRYRRISFEVGAITIYVMWLYIIIQTFPWGM